MVLVADDNHINRFLARRILEKAGYRVLEAEDGEAAVKLSERERPDSILMDIRMPRVNGLEATERIRDTDWGKAIHIIALTADGTHGLKERCYAAGCDAYLQKPISREGLEMTLGVGKRVDA